MKYLVQGLIFMGGIQVGHFSNILYFRPGEKYNKQDILDYLKRGSDYKNCQFIFTHFEPLEFEL